MAYSKTPYSTNPADYWTFVRPDERKSVETLVDEWVIRGPYPKPSGISWEALRALGRDKTKHLCIDGIRKFQFGHDVSRRYHSLAPVSEEALDKNPSLSDYHLSILEARVFGRCCERLGWIEFIRDDAVDVIDARREFQRQSAVETDKRKKEGGGLRDVDALPSGTMELIVEIAHQTFAGILSVGTPISSDSESGTGTGWQRNLACSQSPTCFGGQYDATISGKHSGQRVLADIKAVNHSVNPRASRFNPKNQIQLLLYWIIVALQPNLRDDEIPTGLAWINPLRGEVEYVCADTLILSQNRDVIRTLARKALCLPEDIVMDVDERLADCLANACHR